MGMQGLPPEAVALVRQALQLLPNSSIPIVDLSYFVYGSRLGIFGVDTGVKMSLIILEGWASKSAIVFLVPDGPFERLKMDRRNRKAQAYRVPGLASASSQASIDEEDIYGVTQEILKRLQIILTLPQRLFDNVFIIRWEGESDSLWNLIYRTLTSILPFARDPNDRRYDVPLDPPPASVDESSLAVLLDTLNDLGERTLPPSSFARVLLPGIPFPILITGDTDALGLMPPEATVSRRLYFAYWEPKVKAYHASGAWSVASAIEKLVVLVQEQFKESATRPEVFQALFTVLSACSDYGPLTGGTGDWIGTGWGTVWKLALANSTTESRIRAIAEETLRRQCWKDHSEALKAQGTASPTYADYSNSYSPSTSRLNALIDSLWLSLVRLVGDVTPDSLLTGAPARLRTLFESFLEKNEETRELLEEAFATHNPTRWHLERTSLEEVVSIQHDILRHYSIDFADLPPDAEPTPEMWQEVLFASGLYSRNEPASIYGAQQLGKPVLRPLFLEQLSPTEIDDVLQVTPATRSAAISLVNELTASPLAFGSMKATLKPLLVAEAEHELLEKAAEKEREREEDKAEQEEREDQARSGALDRSQYTISALQEKSAPQPLPFDQQLPNKHTMLDACAEHLAAAAPFRSHLEQLKMVLRSALVIEQRNGYTHFRLWTSTLGTAIRALTLFADDLISRSATTISLARLSPLFDQHNINHRYVPSVITPLIRALGIPPVFELDLSDVGTTKERRKRAVALLLRGRAFETAAFRQALVVLRALDTRLTNPLKSTTASLEQVAVALILAHLKPSATSFKESDITTAIQAGAIRLRPSAIRSALTDLALYDPTEPIPPPALRPQLDGLALDSLATVVGRLQREDTRGFVIDEAEHGIVQAKYGRSGLLWEEIDKEASEIGEMDRLREGPTRGGLSGFEDELPNLASHDLLDRLPPPQSRSASPSRRATPSATALPPGSTTTTPSHSTATRTPTPSNGAPKRPAAAESPTRAPPTKTRRWRPRKPLPSCDEATPPKASSTTE